MKRDWAVDLGSGGRLERALAIALISVCLTSLAPVTRPVAAQQAAATLTILAGSVSVQPSAANGAFAAATDGMDLADGARIRTASGSIALVTFVDGSTVTVQPESEIAIQRAGGGGLGAVADVDPDLYRHVLGARHPAARPGLRVLARGAERDGDRPRQPDRRPAERRRDVRLLDPGR